MGEKIMKKTFGFLLGIGCSGLGVWIMTKPFENPNFDLFNVFMTILCGLLFFVYGMILVKTLLKNKPSYLLKCWYFAIGVALVVEIVTGLNLFGIERRVMKVCNGDGISKSMPYSNENDLHPIIVVDKFDRIDLNYPQDWKSKSVDNLELVACVVAEEWKTIETCEYGAFGQNVLKRQQQELLIAVFEANSGKKLDEFTINGKRPRACWASETFSDRQSVNLAKGENVSSETLFRQLNKWVMP